MLETNFPLWKKPIQHLFWSVELRRKMRAPWLRKDTGDKEKRRPSCTWYLLHLSIRVIDRRRRLKPRYEAGLLSQGRTLSRDDSDSYSPINNHRSVAGRIILLVVTLWSKTLCFLAANTSPLFFSFKDTKCRPVTSWKPAFKS